MDPTLRTVTLPSRRDVLLSDTVGFIRNLPTTLVSAFRATLEEVQRAAILLQVTDATSPTAAEQMAQVESVLRELEAFDKPQIHVLNKIDLFDEHTRAALKDTPESVHISAARALHLERLLAAIDAHLTRTRSSAPACAFRSRRAGHWRSLSRAASFFRANTARTKWWSLKSMRPSRCCAGCAGSWSPRAPTQRASTTLRLEETAANLIGCHSGHSEESRRR